MRTSFLCLAALAQLALNAAAYTSIPLYKRSSEDGVIKAAGKALDNGVLAGRVKVGNPAQEFVVAFDTTTGYSWLRGSRCKASNCRGRCTYYPSNSKDVYNTGQKFSVEYGDSTCVDTLVYTDTFEFSGLTVKDMPFGAAYSMKGFGSGFDGYLGLGRPVDFNSSKIDASTSGSLAKRDTLGSSAFVTNAFQQGSGIASAQFGMYTTTDSSSSFDQSGSVSGTTTTGTTTTNSVAGTNGNTTTTGTTTNSTVTDGTNTATASTPVTSDTTTTTGTDDNVTSGGFGIVKRSSDSSDSEDQVAGYLILGGIDKSIIKGDVEYLRLADTLDGSEKNWDVCIRHASFGGLRFEQEENAIAAISTATNFIAMPPKQADAFHAKFGATYHPDTKLYRIKCSEIKDLPVLKMTLEDHIVEIPASYWTSTVDKNRDCCSTTLGRSNSERDWVLGTSFTNAFYTTFDPDNETVGLAIKKGQKDDGLRVYKKTH